jgi:hypothetical protein
MWKISWKGYFTYVKISLALVATIVLYVFVQIHKGR